MSSSPAVTTVLPCLKKEIKELENRVVKPFEQNQFSDNTVCNSRYTLVSFIPKNLYEQFRRPINLYFLLVACLQFISIIAPVSPFSTLIPLLVAFSVTAIKEGFDDLKKHRSDDEYNSTKVTILREGAWQQCASSSVQVGDVIRVKHDQEIPCDCICIATPTDEEDEKTNNNNNNNNNIESSGGNSKDQHHHAHHRHHSQHGAAAASVYIRTENLDGEMDLKSRDTVSGSTGLKTNKSSVRDVMSACANFTLNYPPPSASFTNFDAQFFIGSDAQALTPNHLLLQSAYLKNVVEMFAIVVYTGNETRCGMNKQPAPQKWAQIDQCVSKYAILIFVCQMILAFSLGLAGFLHNRDDTTWYLAMQQSTSSEKDAGGIIFPLRFFLLTSVMIPISFKFIVDVSKYWMSLVLEWDLAMWDDERGEGMKVKNSSIVEDLAQIQYVLSDKTGTLTKNEMSLHSWTTGADTLYKMDPLTSGSLMNLSPTAAMAASSAPNTNNNNKSNLSRKSASRNAFSAGTSGDNSTRTSQLEQDKGNLIELLVSMAITNTVTVHESSDEQKYQSPSPDEECLCSGASSQGVVLVSRTKSQMTIKIEHDGGSRRTYSILMVFDFSSDRKCMSIVLREEDDVSESDSDVNSSPQQQKQTATATSSSYSSSSSGGQLWLYSKGADDRITSNLTPEARDSDRVSQTQNDVSHFAHAGLRTLMFARRKITPQELSDFKITYDEARTSTVNRSEKMATLQAKFEQGLHFLGASGVEDKLQDDVSGTVHRILEGNVRFWMLTGDKVETAKQIAVSCGLFPPSVASSNAQNCINITGADNALSKLQHLDAKSIQLPVGYQDAQHAAEVRLNPLGWFSTALHDKKDGSGVPLLQSQNSRAPHNLVQTPSGGLEPYGGAEDTGMYLVVEGGPILDSILANPILTERLLDIAMKCVAVVCARVTPGQKATVAQKVKERGNMTLSIGDGGNDVAMIQESHVGVGILGREGQQAARAADFAIVNFKDLATLMFVHGHMSYMRTSYIVLYSFYKSMLISAIQILYNIFFAKLSGVSFWNSFVLTMWNGAFTLPQTICFTLDRCVPREVLVRYPILYRLSQMNYGFTASRFSQYLFLGLFQSGGLLLCVWLALGDGAWADPRNGQPSSLGTSFTSAYTAILLLQVFLVCLFSSSVTWINAFWIFLMPGGYAAMMAVYSLIPRLDYYKTWFHAESTPHALFVFLVSLILFLPPFLLYCLDDWVAPNAARLLRRLFVKGFFGANGSLPGEKNYQLSDVKTASRPSLGHHSSSAVGGVGNQKYDSDDLDGIVSPNSRNNTNDVTSSSHKQFTMNASSGNNSNADPNSQGRYSHSVTNFN